MGSRMADGKPIPVRAATVEANADFSPDGKWVAYGSDETGTREVAVQGFAPQRTPAASIGKWRVSAAGGDKPRWSRDGKAFLPGAGRKVDGRSVRTGSSFEPAVLSRYFRRG